MSRPTDPDAPCRNCGQRRWWRLRGYRKSIAYIAPGSWMCATCRPPEIEESKIERDERDENDEARPEA